MKICIWMNMPSHHQSAFFKALTNRNDIDLQVRYYEKVPEIRKKLGWNDKDKLLENQAYIDSIDNITKSIPDWKERIHIIPGFSSSFLKDLISIVIDENVNWIHWSERSGVNLAKLLNFNYKLINFFYPVFLYLKGYKKYAKQVNKYALGAFAIGSLAKNDFIRWGVNKEKIIFLPYTLEALTTSKKNLNFFNETTKVLFMYIGALDERKGIDILINAFYKLSDDKYQSSLVLIGNDRSNGKYHEQVNKLGITNKVKFLGSINNNGINEYLNQASVFILPTRFDGWGAVLNEAASLAKPMISTDQAGSSYHLIREGENGFMVKAGDENTLLKAMQFYIDHPEQINIHGENSFKIIEEFTPEKSAEKFVSSINKFLENR